MMVRMMNDDGDDDDDDDDKSLRKGIDFEKWWFLKILRRGALGTTTPIAWVWPSYNHAHTFQDGNMII